MPTSRQTLSQIPLGHTNALCARNEYKRWCAQTVAIVMRIMVVQLKTLQEELAGATRNNVADESLCQNGVLIENGNSKRQHESTLRSQTALAREHVSTSTSLLNMPTNH